MAIIPSTDKFFSHSENVNTTIGGPASAQEESHWYTMQDIVDTVGGGGGSTQKVFTALLTQTGDDEPVSTSDGTLTIGVTYYIETNNNGGNFLNVGAPSNDVGTYFIATGTTPTSWGATPGNPANIKLNSNSGAPVATVLENTIGNVYFLYDTTGYYYLLSDGLFTVGKSWTPTVQIFNDTAGLRNGEICEIREGDSSTYNIVVFDQTGAGTNNQLTNTPIEVRVYN